MDNLWPFSPQRGFTETIEWKTEVIQAKSAEQRIALRTVPRTEFKFDYIFDEATLDNAITIARQHANTAIRLPFWQSNFLIGSLNIGQVDFAFDTTGLEYKVGSKVFIYEYDGSSFEELVISTLTNSNINTGVKTLANNYTNAYILPIHDCYIKGSLSYKKTASPYITARVTFITAEDFGIAGASTYPILGDSFLFDDKQLANSGVDEIHDHSSKLFDNLSGNILYQEKTTYPILSTKVNLRRNSFVDLTTLKEWLYLTKGKQKSFYLPKMTRDFVINTDITTSDNYVYIDKPLHFKNEYIGYIYVITNDNIGTVLNVVSVDDFSGTKDRFVLESTNVLDIAAADIKMCTRITRVRSNTDKVQINRMTGQISDVSFSVVEVIA